VPTITRTVSGDVAASLSLLTLTRADTGLTPAGVTLPLAFVDDGGGAWSVTFTDPATAPANGYAYTFAVTWPDGSTDGPFAGTLGAAQAGNAYATQAQVQSIFDAYVLSGLTDLGRLGTPGHIDTVHLQAGFDGDQSFIDWIAYLYEYATPIPRTIPQSQWARLSRLAAEDTFVECYVAAYGLFDAKTPGFGGQMATRRIQLRGDRSKNIKGDIEDFFEQGVAGAPKLPPAAADVLTVGVSRSPGCGRCGPVILPGGRGVWCGW
jgi:hypothetical protein